MQTPIRHSSRAIVINEFDQVLLFKFDLSYLTDGRIVWVTPGGGLEAGETFEDALKREMYEETGLILTDHYPMIYTLDKPFNVGTAKEFISHERYFLVRVNNAAIATHHFTENEKQIFIDMRWWNVKDILVSSEAFGPPNIAELVTDINKHR